MKRPFIICGVLILALLSGCHGTASEVSSPTNSSSIAPTPDPTPPPIPTESVPLHREDADFRNAKWGDSPETVKNYETQITLSENNDALIGDCRIIGYNATAIYIFDDSEKLAGGSYIFFPDEHRSAGKYISTYEDLKEALIDEYGEPTEDIIRALDDQDFIDFYGEEMALSYNNIEYEARWETETTNIYLSLGAPNYQINLGIIYMDKALSQNTSAINDSGL